jgi:DNA-binding MarR family transcriptional regulator
MSARCLDRSPMHLLHRAAQCAENIFIARVRNLTPRQLIVLLTVAAHEGLSQTDLAEFTGVDRNTTTDLVIRLRRKGLLQRRRNPRDARAYVVKPTDEGSRMLRTAEPIAKDVDGCVLAAMPAGRRERFLRSLRLVIETLETGTQKTAYASSREQRQRVVRLSRPSRCDLSD